MAANYAYWPGTNTTVQPAVIQHLDLSGNVLSLLPNGGSVVIDQEIDPAGVFNTIDVSGAATVGTLSSGPITTTTITLENTAGPQIELLAGANTLEISNGTETGAVFDSVLNPPTLLDHLTIDHALTAGSVAAGTITGAGVFSTVSVTGGTTLNSLETTAATVGTLASGPITTSSVSLTKVTGSPIQLTAGATALTVSDGSGTGIVYDTALNPPTTLDHLTVTNALTAGSMTAPTSTFSGSVTTPSININGGTLTGTQTTLKWNGSDLVTTATNSNVADWSKYPAASDVNLAGRTLGGVGHFGQTGDATMGFVDSGYFENTFSFTHVLGDFWVGEKKDYLLNRPGCRFYCGHFQVGGAGGTNDVVNWPSFAVYPTTVDFGSIVQPCRSFNVVSTGGINLTSVVGVGLYGGGGVSCNGGLGVSLNGGAGVSILGGGGVAVTGLGGVAVTGGAVTVTGLLGVAVTGGGGVAITGGGGVAITGGIGVSVLGGAGVAVTGGGGVAITGGGGVALTGGTIEITPDALYGGGDVNINAGGNLNVKGAGAIYANGIGTGDAGYLTIGSNGGTVSISNVTVLGGSGPGATIQNVASLSGSSTGINFQGSQIQNFHDLVPIQQQQSIYADTTLPAAYFIGYNFAPGSALNVTLPAATQVGSWIRITNSSLSGSNHIISVLSAESNQNPPVCDISVGQCVRLVVGLDLDTIPAWFPG